MTDHAPVYDGSTGEMRPPTPAELAPVVVPEIALAPTTVTRVQFAHQAAIDGLCTQDEALAWGASGTALPSKVAALVGALPAGEQFAAKMSLCKASFDRFDPTTIKLTDAFGWDDVARGAFWTAAAML